MTPKAKTSAKLPSVAESLTSQIDICGKSQKEIAFELGYTKPNIITMFKQGLTKVPIPKVEALARSIGADPVYLLRIVLSEYAPDTLKAIESIIGFAITENEKEIIKAIRKETNNTNPSLAKTQEGRQKLSAFVKTLK